MVKASPLAYRDQSNGRVLPGDVIVQLRDHAIGEQKGLLELSRLLAEREQELREQVKQQENK